MTSDSAPAARPGLFRYGIEAPYAVIGLAAGGLASLVLAFWAPWWFVPAVLLLAQAGIFLHTTVRGKLRVWDKLLDRLALTGDERALDLGCGRGPVLLALARRLPRGRAVGIDLWRSKDQSGNSEEVTLANAAADGLTDRIELHTGDMTALPFADASFDVVTSALAVHNIPDAASRAKSITEAWRVLRPGGRLVLADFRHTRDYAEVLRAQGATDVVVRALGLMYWYGGPWTATSVVTATRN